MEGEVAGVVVGEIDGAGPVADDENLHKAEQRASVAIAGVVLVFDDLLHSPARADAEGFQFNLDAGHSVDEEDDIVAVVAVVGIDAQLIDDLEGVFAPVLEIDEGAVERRAVVASEGIDAAEGFGSGKNVRGDDFFQQAREFRIRKMNAIECLKFLAEVGFQRGAVADVWAVFVFEFLQGANEAGFDVFLPKTRGRPLFLHIVLGGTRTHLLACKVITTIQDRLAKSVA